MAQMIREIRQKIRMCNIERVPERLAPAIREHIAIADALINRDPEAARSAMIDHLVNVRQGMLQSFGFLQYADRARKTA
ncbi:FCD domain protein [compost metagenome]